MPRISTDLKLDSCYIAVSASGSNMDILPPCSLDIQLKSSFNGAMDKWKRWTISEELSEGCGARDAEWEYDML